MAACARQQAKIRPGQATEHAARQVAAQRGRAAWTRGGARGLDLQQQLAADKTGEGSDLPSGVAVVAIVCFVVVLQRLSQGEDVGSGSRNSNLGEVLRELQEWPGVCRLACRLVCPGF